MKSFVQTALLLLHIATSLPSNAQNQNIVFRSKMSFPGQTIANVCGYADNGREYALLGGSLGLIIVDVTNPDVPVQITQVPGPNSLWKEIKTYLHFAYTVTEGGQGINIVDLSNLPMANVNSHFYTGDGIIKDTLQTIHALHIDVTKGFLYAYGTNLFNGGAVVFDLNQDPFNPKYVGKYDQLGYIHDGYVDNDTLYACHIYDGLFAVVDMQDKANPVLLNTQNTPGKFTHNAWLSEDRKTVFTTDEVPGSFVAAYDVSNLDDIKFLDKVRSNPSTGSIGHNTHIRGKHAITAWYTDGVTIIDATKPDNLVQVGNYDTYPQSNGQEFEGCWGVYPFLPSGNLIVGNMTPGEMYLLSPTYTRAAYLEGNITEAQTGNPIPNAKVELVGNPNALKFSNNTGHYGTGQALPGAVQVKVSRLGYLPAFGAADLETGLVKVLDFALEKSPPFTVSGKVIDAATGLPVPNASVGILSPDISYNATADASGNFALQGILAGEYDFVAGAWGYLYKALIGQELDASQQVTLQLEKGYQDDFAFDYGWEASGTSLTGKWVRGVPIGVSFGILLSPDADVPDDLGDQCYVTGNANGNPDEDDVESGTSILRSPVMDLSAFANPHISAQYWCSSFNIFQQSLDSIKFFISNGTEEKLVLAAPGNFPGWLPLNFDVTDFVPLSPTMRLRVYCYDNPNLPTIDLYEAAFDNFLVTDQVLSSPSPVDLAQLTVQPNPFYNSTSVAYMGVQGKGRLLVFDIFGRLVETRNLSGPEGWVELGSGLAKGAYVLQLVQENGNRATAKLLKVD